MSAYSEKWYTVYRSVVFKNNTLGTVDITFIKKPQFLIFFHFSGLRNLVKCMDSMDPCYSLPNMKVIWLYLVSALLPLQWGEGRRNLIWKFDKTFWWQNFFLHLWQDKPLGGIENKWWTKIYYYITTLSFTHFFRNSQQPEKWSVSFKNFFRKFECISRYLLISSTLQFQF